MRVLIVEDDLHIKFFRVRTLELGARNGLMGILTSLALFRAQALFEVASSCSDIAYEVESASTPNEALARLASERFDLVLLDFMMQDATGEQVVPRVRSLAGESTSVVVISSYKELDMIEACLRAGADAYMVKPLQLDQVRSPPINKPALRAHYSLGAHTRSPLFITDPQYVALPPNARGPLQRRELAAIS